MMQQGTGQHQEDRPDRASDQHRPETGSAVAFPGRVRPYLLLARLVLLLERLAPICLTAFVVIGLFLTAAWFGLFRYLPPWLHATILALAGLTLCGLIWRQVRAFHW